jgi:hypothetical protein
MPAASREGGDENCTRMFMQSAWLKNHLKRGVHSGGMWRPWGGSAKQAQPKSDMQQRLPGSLAATLAASVEAGAVVGISPVPLVDWGGKVVIFGGGEVQLPEPACGVAVFRNFG